VLRRWEEARDEGEALLRLGALLGGSSNDNVLIFVNSVERCDSLAADLRGGGWPQTAKFHGGLSKAERHEALQGFDKEGGGGILVATDAAARGVDFRWVGHVVEFEFARAGVDQIHRAGRTARAGREGKSESFSSSNLKSK
jgi:ATP-dependent RNA helicase RhlE